MLRISGSQRQRWLVALALPLLLFVMHDGQRIAQAQTRTRVVALVSHDAPPYKEALAALQQQLSAPGVQVDPYLMQGDGRAANNAIQAARDGASVLITLGTAATQAAVSAELNTPIVAALVFNSDMLKRPTVTAVTLDMPVETQFDWLRKILPEQHTVGVLYNPRENQQRVDAAARIAQARGLKLLARPVETPQDLPAALDGLSRQIEVLWTLTDNVVISSQTAQPILLFCFRNKIPLVGLSSTWVKAGALYSLDWDYGDIGKQAGELAQRIVHGTKPAELPPAMPRKLTYAINLKSAGQLGVDVPRPLVQGARQVFE
jgi:putative ABC transport system substrate-binding protein